MNGTVAGGPGQTGTGMNFDGIKVFSATKQKDREELGDVATRWLKEMRDQVEIVDKTVTQSSDSEYHCLTIILFYRYKR
jgi:hypothetical protein